MKSKALIATWLAGALIGAAGTAQAATVTATVDWFSIKFQSLSLEPLSDVTPSFSAGNFYSYVSSYFAEQTDWSESEDWMSDLAITVGGAQAAITGASFPDKTLNDDGSDPDWRLIPNPVESLDVRIDSSSAAGGAGIYRSFTVELEAQSLLLVSFDYLLTYDLGPLPTGFSYLGGTVGMETQGDDFESYTEAFIYPEEGMSSDIKQGRLVFALTNATDEVASYEVGAFARAFVSAVPEPSMLVMFLGGLGLIGVRSVRSRRT